MTTFPMKRGEFTLLRKIGEGGMAEVFLAEREGDEDFKTLVALKRLHGGFALDQYFIRQLVQEARLLGQLQHANVVRVHDLRRIDDEYHIVMEYIDGIDLAQAVHVHRDRGLRFPLSIFFHIALSLCEALDFAHTALDLEGRPIRLIHRDIKPSNVLISNRGVVKLTDFGIARVGDTSNTGSVVKGTANYMSPEQAAGEQNLTAASDIFSLGAVFWEVLTLTKLVPGSNYLNVINSIKELNVGLKDITKKGIEPGLRMILLRMLARKRELRYQNMGLVLKDLRFVAEQMKVDLSPSHLREYMAKITNLARDAAAQMNEDSNIRDIPGAPSEDAPSAPVTPASVQPPVADEGDKTTPPGSAIAAAIAGPAAAADTGGGQERAFQDSVAALRALVQSGAAPIAGQRAVTSSRPPQPAQPSVPLTSADRAAPKMERVRPPTPDSTPKKAMMPTPQSIPSVPGPGITAPPSAVGLRVAQDIAERLAAQPAPAAPAVHTPGSPAAPPPLAATPPPSQADPSVSAPSLATDPHARSVGEPRRFGAPTAGTIDGVDSARRPAPKAPPSFSGGRVTGLPPSTGGRIQAVDRDVPAAAATTGEHRVASVAPVPLPPRPGQAAPRATPPPHVSPPPIGAIDTRAMPGTSFEAPEDDDYDDFDDYEATRRKNQRVLRIGASLAAVILVAIVILVLPSNPKDDVIPGPEVAAKEEPSVDDPFRPAVESGIEADGDATALAEPMADPIAPRTPPAATEERSPTPQARTSVDRSAARSSSTPTRSSSTPTRSSAASSASEPSYSSSDRRSSRSAPAETPREPDPTPEPRREPEPESSDWDDTVDDGSASDWSPSSYSEAGAEESTDEDWGKSDSSSDLASPYAADASSSTDDSGAVPAGASADRAAEMVRNNMADMNARARRGRLEGSEMTALADIPTGTAEYRPSRALMLAQYEATGDQAAHCEMARQVVTSRENRADPQFNLELGKCLLREGSYQDALTVARVAEQNAQDIPSRIRTDRQLKIWEVQAKAYKGLYQVTENLDFIDDSIVVWKRYLNMAKHTYRQREADQAGDEIRALSDLARGAL